MEPVFSSNIGYSLFIAIVGFIPILINNYVNLRVRKSCKVNRQVAVVINHIKRTCNKGILTDFCNTFGNSNACQIITCEKCPFVNTCNTVGKSNTRQAVTLIETIFIDTRNTIRDGNMH